jgi:hypothetical protein
LSTHVDGDVVGLAADVAELVADAQVLGPRQAQRRLHRQRRVVAHNLGVRASGRSRLALEAATRSTAHLHAEAQRRIADGGADGAQADDA